MKQRPRIYYTEEQKALMWERWQKGDSLEKISQLFGRYHSSVEGIVALISHDCHKNVTSYVYYINSYILGKIIVDEP